MPVFVMWEYGSYTRGGEGKKDGEEEKDWEVQRGSEKTRQIFHTT